ncbi:MAG: 3-dehydroquinate synthase [Pseudomonadota bacterium]|nr:3-dehydroquinate synthase [Pseudomonadota bacterium]
MRDSSTLRVELGSRSYPILIGAGLLDLPVSFGAERPGQAAVIVSNDVVAPLYATRLAATLHQLHGSDVHQVVLADGEAHKDFTALQAIFNALLGQQCDRQTAIYALGGGVTGDVAGFAAACYMRGISYVQVPTTLLAQVDSAVGGKTAINHPLGKNLIGAFHQPSRVVIDVETLATLPQRELVAGLAEVIKYGAVADAAFLAWIEDHLDELLRRDEPAMIHAIRRSCELKAAVVAADEREGGGRVILNFGHTFGHAIETGSGYGRWLHGEAVGCGMVLAAALSERVGRLDAVSAARLQRLIERAGLPVVAPDFGFARYRELMGLDKKAAAGRLRFVLLEGLGRAVVDETADDDVRFVLATPPSAAARGA